MKMEHKKLPSEEPEQNYEEEIIDVDPAREYEEIGKNDSRTNL